MLDVALEGTVVAVAADQGHHFSKPQKDHIILLEGHGVEETRTPARSFATGISPEGSLACPICVRST